MRGLKLISVVCGGLVLSAAVVWGTTDDSAIHRDILLPPRPENPRNSEGDFIELKDGRVLFVYTHFTGGASDHAVAHLAARYSDDGGKTWTEEDAVVVANEGGFNVMSVSLLRLPNDEIALFYMRKNSLEDCRPVLRISRDEARTWSEPQEIITDVVGYYVLNNDRMVQTSSGRLLCPVALHNRAEYDEPDWEGILMVYFSDDMGETWQRSASTLKKFADDGSRVLLQEPGVLELRDGRIMMWARTNSGSQYLSWSSDEGDTWTSPVPSSIMSPRSPASIERLPGGDALMMIWNDHAEVTGEALAWRSPLAVALSFDEGETWEPSRLLEDNPEGWYCYTAIDFVGDRVLLAHCAGIRSEGGLNVTQMTSFGIEWLLGAAPIPLMVEPGESLVSLEFGADHEADEKGLKFRKETVSAVKEGALHVMPPSLVKKVGGEKTKWGDSNFARAGLVGLPQEYVCEARWKYIRPSDADALAKGLVYIDLGHRMIRVTLTRDGAVLLLENHLMGREEKRPAIVLQEAPALKLRPDHWYDILVEVKGNEVVVQIDDHVLYGKHDLIAEERYDTFNFDATGDGYLLDRIEVRAAGNYRADWAERRGKVLFNHSAGRETRMASLPLRTEVNFLFRGAEIFAH